MKNKSHKFIAFLLYFVFIFLGIAVSSFFNVAKWPKSASLLLILLIFILIGSVVSNLYIFLVTKARFPILTKVKKEAIAIFKFVRNILYKLVTFIKNTFEFASVLTIILVAFLYIPIIFDFFLLMIILSILYVVFLVLSFVTFFIGYPLIYVFKNNIKAFKISRVITSLLAFSLLTINFTNGVIKIPKLLDRTYTITYHLNEDETLVGGKDFYYYYEGLTEEEIGTVEKEGYVFNGWYLDSMCFTKFESFEGYVDKGNIDLYPSFEYSDIQVEYVFRGYDFSNEYTELESSKEKKNYQIGDYIVLDRLEGLKDYSFVGWTMKDVSAEEFLTKSYSLINAFSVQQEYIENNKITLYALFVKTEAKELAINKIIDINQNIGGEYAVTNVTYKVSNLLRNTYTLVINHGEYVNDKSKACFIEAVIYNKQGTILSKVSSKDGGGQMGLVTEEVYIRFNEVDSEGNILKESIHKNALIMIVEYAKNAKTLAPVLSNNEEGTKVLERNFGLDVENSLSMYKLDDRKYVYNYYNYKFDIIYRDVHYCKEIGFTVSKGAYIQGEIYVAVTFFYEGEYVDSGYASLGDVNKNSFIAAYDLNKLTYEKYTMNISIYSEVELSNNIVNFVMQ